MLLWLPLLLTACDSRCGGGQPAPCFEVDGGRYLVLEPPDADGPLPALLWFHGYGGSAATTADKGWLVDGLARRGVLGVLADGVNNTWAHVGSPSDSRDELAYVDAVLDDVQRRYDLDPGRLWVSGFSQGGSMAWDAACYRGGRFAAAIPASGAFWVPLPEECPAGPLPLRHTHGLDDTTVPMEGRPIGSSARQGDVLEGVAVWRRTNGCPDEPDRVYEDGPSTCQAWTSCTSGAPLELCLYDGGHQVPDGWLGRNLDWVTAR